MMTTRTARAGVATALTVAGLTAAGLLSPAAPAFAAAAGEVTATVSNLSAANAQMAKYTLVKCPSTTPYITSATASAKTGEAEDQSYTHFSEFWQSVPDGSAQMAKVNFFNSQTFQEEAKYGPVVVTVTLTLTCSNMKPAGLPRPEFKQSVYVRGLSYGNLQVSCPSNYPTALEARENHPGWFLSYGATTAGRVGAASWYNPDEYVFGTADVTVACGP
nr:hypothetical protein [Microbispora cellulosiformans]